MASGQARLVRLIPILGMGLCLVPLRASAQATPTDGSTADGHGFDPAPLDREVRDPLVVHRVGGWAPQQGYFTGLFSYASDPLVWCSRTIDGLECADEDNLFVDVYSLMLSGGYAPTERLRFYANLPTFVSADSDHSDSGGGIGDLRLGGQLAAFRGEGPFQLGFVPWLDLPTGNQDRYMGDSGVGGGAAIAGSLSVGPLTLSSDLGASFTPASNLFPEGFDSLLTGLAAGISPSDSWGFTAETRVAPSFLTDPVPGTGTPAEMIYSAKHRRGSIHMQAGMAHALTTGPGAATWRAFAGLGWTSTSPVDFDGDGYLHEYDNCPYEAEAFNNWLDADGCPEDPVFFQVQASLNSRPISARDVDWNITGALPNADPSMFVSNPGRTVQIEAVHGGCFLGSAELMVEPDMPTVPVPLTAAMGSLRLSVTDARTGAPITNAHLHWLPDGQDPACHPRGEQALSASGILNQSVGIGPVVWVVEAPGLGTQLVSAEIAAGQTARVDVRMGPDRARVVDGRLFLADHVWFHYNSFSLQQDALDTLDEVAAMLLAHPELGKLRVIGHTDDRGKGEFNMTLSDRRAQAAASRLVSLGVPAEQLEIVGYGATQPAARNNTPRGRARNRRVELVLVESER